MAEGLQGGIGAVSLLGSTPNGNGMATIAPIQVLSDGNKPKKKPKPYDMAVEMKKFGKTPMVYDNNETPANITKRVAQKMGVNPSLLFSSAWQEGMNKAAISPDDVSMGYNEAKITDEFPVDGFVNYGVDTIGDKWDKLKGYLPQGFENKLKFYKTTNEKSEPITTAAFKTNEDALMAKAAMMKYEADNIFNYAKSKGVDLDDKAKNYFMLAAYNGGGGNAQKMINEYIKAPDKNKFIDEGQTGLGEIHKNIKVRLDNMATADELLK